MKKKLSIILAFTLFSTQCFADTISGVFDSNTGKVSISGSFNNASVGAEAFLRLYNAGADKSTTAPFEGIQKIDQATLDDLGNFSFVFPINFDADNFASGSMKYYVDCEGSTLTGSVFVAERDELTKYILDAYNDGSDLSVIADANYEPLYDDVTGLSGVDKKLGVNAYSYFEENMIPSTKKLTLQNMTKKGLTGVDDLNQAFVEAVVVVGIKNPKDNGTGHVSALLEGCGSAVGLSLSKYNSLSSNNKNIVNKALRNGSFNNISELQAAINKAISSLPTDGGGGGTSGGGGGGGGGGGTSIVAGGESTSGQTTDDNKTKSKIFTDLTNFEWARTSIERLFDKGIVNGITETTYGPAQTTTREQMIKLVVLAFGLAGSSDETFADVEDDAWYAPSISTAISYRLTQGKGDGTFGVGEMVTRQDAAVFLSRAISATDSKFKAASNSVTLVDFDEISDYAKDAVSQMSSYGIIKGDENSRFNGTAPCTRAEIAVMIDRILMGVEE